MRKPIDSPFSPGADSVPRVWAGRTAQLSDWRDVLRPRRISGIPERGRTILGEAGLGKSTLVRRIASEASERGDWVTPQLRIPSGADPLRVVATALLRLAENAGLSAKRDRAIADQITRVETVLRPESRYLSVIGQGPSPIRPCRNCSLRSGEQPRRPETS